MPQLVDEDRDIKDDKTAAHEQKRINCVCHYETSRSTPPRFCQRLHFWPGHFPPWRLTLALTPTSYGDLSQRERGARGTGTGARRFPRCPLPLGERVRVNTVEIGASHCLLLIWVCLGA